MLISEKDCMNAHGSVINKVIHVGAHHGEEAEFYFKNGAKHVYWFEANREMMRYLFEATKQYSMKQEYICQVLSDVDDEEVEFKITNNGQSSSILELGTHQTHYPHIKVVSSKKLKTKRLDTLAKNLNLNLMDVDFVNLDVQGAELKVLKGFGNLLETNLGLKTIYSEVNFEQVYIGAPHISELDEYLSQFNFQRSITLGTQYNWGDAIYTRR